MRRTHPLGLAQALLFLTTAVLVLPAWSDPPASDPSKQKAVTVTEKDAGTTVNLPPGGGFVVQLPGEGQSGRTWKLVKHDPKQFEQIVRKPEIVAGAKEKDQGQTLFAIFHFKALQSGDLELHYLSTAEGDKKVVKEFKVRVEVQSPR